MSKRGCFVIALFLLSVVANADVASTEFEITNDTDEVTTTRLLIGAKWENSWKLGFLSGRYQLYDPKFGKRRFTEARGVFSKKDQVNIDGFVSKLFNSEKEFVIGRVTLSQNPTSKWYIEAGAEHNLVDTVLAVDGDITFDSYSVAADYTLSPGKTIVGHVAYQEFSDYNNRDIYTLKYIHKITDNFSLQFGRKNQTGDFNPAEYWSPDSRRITSIGFVYYQPLLDGKWAMKLNTSIGPQTIDDLNGQFGEMKLDVWGSISDNTRVSLRHVRLYSSDGFDSYKWNYTGLIIDYTF